MEMNDEKVVEQADKGVVALPPVLIPPEILDSIRKKLEVEHARTQNGLILDVNLDTGINFVVAHRTEFGWEVDGYFGRKWSGELKAGIQVSKRW